ncbi:TetR family transcriptional regulator [Heyndrickxia sp. NPDC080065]|uniref:TetR family transcriptional regulator n=1 Tax=Heyndrickxia sp. NPDC080065 TaxID=3390568 RepID=UPI003D05C46B
MSPRVSEEYKRKKKSELLQAARRVFIEKGYTHVTMQDVMDEANVSRGGLYAYFNHIDHLFMEVLQLDDQDDILFFEPSSEHPLWTQLTNWLRLQQQNIDGIHHSLVRAKAEFFLTSKFTYDKENFPYITERYENLKNAIQNFIQKGIDQEEFFPLLSPEAIALYFISFFDGLMLDTFQLGAEKTKVKTQLIAFEHSLEAMLFSKEKIMKE